MFRSLGSLCFNRDLPLTAVDKATTRRNTWPQAVHRVRERLKVARNFSLKRIPERGSDRRISNDQSARVFLSAPQSIRKQCAVSQDQSHEFRGGLSLHGRNAKVREVSVAAVPRPQAYHASIVCAALSDLQSGRFDRSDIYLNRSALHDARSGTQAVGSTNGSTGFSNSSGKSCQSWDGFFTSLFASVILRVGRP